MPDTGPSQGLISRFFKKKQGDINLPNESGRTDPRLKKKKGLLAVAKETKKKYNPFDRVASVLRKATGDDEEE